VKALVLNILGFQCAWWACMLSAQAGAPWIGLVVTAAVVGLHLSFSPARRVDRWFVPVAAVIGYAADTVAVSSGALVFDVRLVAALPAPLWIGALWLAFATTLNTTFAWLRGRLMWAAVLGAVSGPVSYAAGVAFGVAAMPNVLFSGVLLAVLWGGVLVAQVALAGYAQRPSADAAAPVAVNAGGM
jgi:hypothetical protein